MNIYLFHNWVNKLFSEEFEVPRTLGRWQGPPHIGEEQQYEFVLPFKVSLE